MVPIFQVHSRAGRATCVGTHMHTGLKQHLYRNPSIAPWRRHLGGYVHGQHRPPWVWSSPCSTSTATSTILVDFWHTDRSVRGFSRALVWSLCKVIPSLYNDTHANNFESCLGTTIRNCFRSSSKTHDFHLFSEVKNQKSRPSFSTCPGLFSGIKSDNNGNCRYCHFLFWKSGQNQNRDPPSSRRVSDEVFDESFCEFFIPTEDCPTATKLTGPGNTRKLFKMESFRGPQRGWFHFVHSTVKFENRKNKKSFDERNGESDRRGDGSSIFIVNKTRISV